MTRVQRWWWAGLGGLVLLVDLWLLATAWSPIVHGHPAYLVTLVGVALAAVAAVAWGLAGRRERPAPQASRWWWVLRALAAVGVVAGLAVLVSLRPHAATSVALDALRDGDGVVVEDGRTRIVLQPTGPVRPTGLVFYPGAKVDPRAYAAILRPLAEAGHVVVILKVPFGMAFTSPNAASRAIEAVDGVEQWVVAGHSLGGVVAARYARGHDVAGLVLWASYPAASLAGRDDLPVLSVSGTNDGLTTPEDIERSKAKLPAATTFVAVPGAVHASFGDYGPQRGDGTPGITHDEAQRQIVEATGAFLAEDDARV